MRCVLLVALVACGGAKSEAPTVVANEAAPDAVDEQPPSFGCFSIRGGTRLCARANECERFRRTSGDRLLSPQTLTPCEPATEAYCFEQDDIWDGGPRDESCASTEEECGLLHDAARDNRANPEPAMRCELRR